MYTSIFSSGGIKASFNYILFIVFAIIPGDLKTSIRAGEQQNKVVTENIEKVENHFPQMVQDINLYTVRSAKLRDAGDMFSKSLRDYAATEVPSLQRGLGAFAECFAAVQDHRNALVTRLENKVTNIYNV